jgi:hypothetical protein
MPADEQMLPRPWPGLNGSSRWFPW